MSAESRSSPELEASLGDSSRAEASTELSAAPALPWQTLFEAALDAMLIINSEGVLIEANRAACALLELSRQALVGRQIADFLLPDTDLKDLWQRFIATDQVRGEQQLRLADGIVKTVEFAATAHVYPNHHLAILRDITERKCIETERNALSHQLEQWVISSSEKLQRTEAALRLQQQRIDSILNSLECVVWSVHPTTLETIYVNAAVETIYGYSAEAFLSNPGLWFSCIHPEDEPLLMADIRAVMNDLRIDREYRIFRADGTERWVRGQARLVRNADGQPTRIDGTTTDISQQQAALRERKQAEQALKENQATQQLILNAIPDLMMRVNRDGYILNLISGGEITLYSPIQPYSHQSVYQGFPRDLADLRMHYVRLALDTGTPQRYEHALELNNELRYEESRVVPINEAEVLVIVRDITDRKQAEATQAELNQKLQRVNAELNRLATVDGLTEIANRRSFDQALDLEWQRARRQQKSLSLILCDIDYFKPYNDNYGHLAGDDCLRQVAQVLNTVVQRPGDLAARYGGEEFVLLLPDTTLEGAIGVIEKLQAAIAQRHLPHAYSEVARVITLSFGVVCHRPSVKEHSPRELVHRTDLALYQAKAQGRNCYVVGESLS